MVLPLRDDLPVRRLPLVTLILIAVNAVIWLFWQPTFDPAKPTALGPEGNRIEMPADLAFLFEHTGIPCEVVQKRPLTIGEVRLLLDAEGPEGDYCGRSPADARQGDGEPLVPGKNIWLAEFMTMFFHANLAHIFFNMLILFILGNNVESRLGPLRFLLLYLFSGIAATAMHTLMSQQSVLPSLGASGAVAGVMGAFLLMFPFARVFAVVMIPFPVTAYLPAFLVLGAWFVIQFTPLIGPTIAAWAHIGGFVTGLLLTPLLMVSIRPKRLAPEPAGPVYATYTRRI